MTEIEILSSNTRRCPECFSDKIKYDSIRDELSCCGCGLVVAAPPHFVAGTVNIDLPWHKTFHNEISYKTKKFGVIKGWIGEHQPYYK